MASNLMSKARALASSRGATTAAALVIMPLMYTADAVADWQIDNNGSFPFAELMKLGETDQYGNVTWVSANLPGSQASAELINGGSIIRESGHFGSVTGDVWTSETGADSEVFFRFSSGGYLMPISPGDYFASTYDFNFSSTGGTVNWSLVYNYGGQGVDSLGNFSPEYFDDIVINGSAGSGSHSFDGYVAMNQFQLEHLFESYGDWTGWVDVLLYVQWTDFSPADTLEFTIPNNSIDIGMNLSQVPLPGAFYTFFSGILILASIFARRRYPG